jgi:head-tail adaptor
VNAGELRERVRFDRLVEVEDGAGNMQSGWAPNGEDVAAKIQPLRGSEAVLAGKLQGRQPVEITVRWSPRLATGDSAIHTDDRAVNLATGEAYNIRSIENPDMRKVWLTMIAEAGGA